MTALDPHVRALLLKMRESGAKPLSDSSIADARETARHAWKLQGEAADVASVTDRTIPGPGGDLSVRVYRPEAEAALPVLVFFHGGGFVVGDIETSDRPCRTLANETRCLVVSVDYRLAPEHQYPAAVEDAYAAVEWIAENTAELGGMPGRLGVAGESAGATLAAVTALMARDRGGPNIGLQLLICPVTEFYSAHPSRHQCADGYWLSAADIETFSDLYLGDPARATEPYCSPLRASDHSGLPPAIVVTAGYDPLRDEGTAYAKALARAGVDVRLEENPGMIHGFWSFGGVIAHTAAVNHVIGRHVRQMFSDDTSSEKTERRSRHR